MMHKDLNSCLCTGIPTRKAISIKLRVDTILAVKILIESGQLKIYVATSTSALKPYCKGYNVCGATRRLPLSPCHATTATLERCIVNAA